MGDPNVERWHQHGTIVMWMNRRDSRREWNIAADDAACDALLQLFYLMENGEWSGKKELHLTKPMKTPDHGGNFPFRSATQLTIKYPKDRVPEDHWQFTETDRKLLLEIGLARLQELRDAINDMKQGGGDYLIGDRENNPLWIWWWINDFIVPKTIAT